MKMQARWVLGVALGAATVSACKGDGEAPPATQAPAASPAPAAPQPQPDGGRVSLGPAVEAKGRVIEIQMVTDETGNRFVPNAVTAQPGDVLRYVLVTGVHNIHFPAETNPGVPGLPAPSELFNTVGHTKELVVGLKPGAYHFQCDPHAALGMVGTLTVR